MPLQDLSRVRKEDCMQRHEAIVNELLFIPACIGFQIPAPKKARMWTSTDGAASRKNVSGRWRTKQDLLQAFMNSNMECFYSFWFGSGFIMKNRNGRVQAV